MGINQRPAGRYFGLTRICNGRQSWFFDLWGKRVKWENDQFLPACFALTCPSMICCYSKKSYSNPHMQWRNWLFKCIKHKHIKHSLRRLVVNLQKNIPKLFVYLRLEVIFRHLRTLFHRFVFFCRFAATWLVTRLVTEYLSRPSIVMCFTG